MKRICSFVVIFTVFMTSLARIDSAWAMPDEQTHEASTPTDATTPQARAAAASEADAAESTGADSTAAFPDKRPARSTWEHVASFPGTLVYIPFWILFQAAGGLIYVNERYDMSARVMDVLTTDDGRRGVFPVYSSRTGGGLTFFWKDAINPGSRFDMTASWGVRGRQAYQIRQRRMDLFGGVLQSGMRADFRHLSDESFFGIGPDSKKEDETNFSHKRAVGEIGIGKRPNKQTVFGVIAGVSHNILDEGRSNRTPSTTDLFDETTLPGISNEATMGEVQAGLYYDTRNRAFRPTAGFEGEIRGGISSQFNGSDYGYTFALADLSRFVHLFADRMLYLRVAAMFTDPLSNRATPFYALSELGQVESIRGFTRGRFRDRDLILGTAEYRYPIWRTLDALFFVDAGQVSSNIINDFDSDNIKVTYGGGIRVWHKAGTLMRVELGKSEDGFRFHFILNPSPQSRRSYVYF